MMGEVSMENQYVVDGKLYGTFRDAIDTGATEVTEIVSFNTREEKIYKTWKFEDGRWAKVKEELK